MGHKVKIEESSKSRKSQQEYKRFRLRVIKNDQPECTSKPHGGIGKEMKNQRDSFCWIIEYNATAKLPNRTQKQLPLERWHRHAIHFCGRFLEFRRLAVGSEKAIWWSPGRRPSHSPAPLGGRRPHVPFESACILRTVLVSLSIQRSLHARLFCRRVT